jgi:hypothetical protein
MNGVQLLGFFIAAAAFAYAPLAIREYGRRLDRQRRIFGRDGNLPRWGIPYRDEDGILR